MPLIIFHARLGFAKFLRKWANAHAGQREEAPYGGDGASPNFSMHGNWRQLGG